MPLDALVRTTFPSAAHNQAAQALFGEPIIASDCNSEYRAARAELEMIMAMHLSRS